MVIILVRRCVKLDKEAEFLASFDREKPTSNPAFIDETLTKVNDSQDLPEAMRSLHISGVNCVTYLNVAYWKSAQSFYDHFKPSADYFDPKIEVCKRERIVLDAGMLDKIPLG
jgi:hypothetical protein